LNEGTTEEEATNEYNGPIYNRLKEVSPPSRGSGQHGKEDYVMADNIMPAPFHNRRLTMDEKINRS
jgi:hypothetical protein